MAAETRILKIGDVLYGHSRFHGLNKVAIDRTTKVSAFAGNIRLRVEHRDGEQEYGGGNYYNFPTPELEHQYKDQQLRRRLRRLLEKQAELPLEQVIEILKIIQPKQDEQSTS